MSYKENKTNASNIEIIPCERINCKGAAPCVLNINSYMNVCEFEEQVMKYMCNMRPVMDEFICVNLDVIADRPVDFIQSLVEGYIRYDGVHIMKNYRVEYGKMDKEGNNHIYILEAPDGACDYDMAVSVFAMVCIEGKAPSDWHWKEITEKVFAKKEESTEVMHVKGIDWKEAVLLKRKMRRVLGAIIGDIVGSVYEFNEIKTKDFPLFSEHCCPTDDSMMTLAVASALVECKRDYSKLAAETIKQMQLWGKKYPKAGYGSMFCDWLETDNPQPYNSFGNGSAMRVSPVAYVAKSIEEVKELSRIVTSVTHNHPEGIKGAEATAVATYMALHGSKKEEIFTVIDNEYYPMNFTLDEIRADYEFNETCQETVPQALKAFFEATDFEDAIRNAVSIGGDSDTIAAITGAVAGAYYGVPYRIEQQALKYMDGLQKKAYRLFCSSFMFK